MSLLLGAIAILLLATLVAIKHWPQGWEVAR